MSLPISDRAPESTGWWTGSTGNSCSPIERAGRDGFLHLAFARRGDRSILTRRRWTHPLQALEPVRAGDGSLCLMMLNTGGGILGGDRLRIDVEVGANAGAVLITASAGKVYRTAGAPAFQETTINLGPGAVVEYLPDHLIPHAGAMLQQSLRLQMAPGSRAIVYDAFAAGRIGRGERWRFRELSSETIVARGALPLYISRARIVPESIDPARLGLAEGFNYLASLVIAGDRELDWEVLSAELDRVLLITPDVYGGVSQIGSGGCAVRLMAYTAESLRAAAAGLWGVARRRVVGLEPFDLRKS